MLRRLGTNKKSLVIIPVALALALTWLFLPVKEVSIEPYGTLSLESKIVITTGYQAAYASPDYEYKKPTAFTDTGAFWNRQGQAYDLTAEDTTTAADSDTSPSSTDPWITYHTWDTKGQTYTATDLFVNWVTNGAYNTDHWGIQYTKDGGTNWYDLVTMGVNNDTAMVQSSVALDLDQDLTLVQVKLVYVRNSPKDTAVTYIYDIWTRGTYTPVLDISNLPTSKNFGNVTTGQSYWSNGSAPTFSLDDGECFFTVTNNSSQAVNIAIRSTHFSGGAPAGWDLGGTAGEDIVVLKAGASGTTANEGAMFILTNDDQTNFISGLLGLPSAPNNTKKWELKMETPTVFGNYDVKTATITLTAAF